MPSNIDKAFIENLQNFTDSLESIVELLKEQTKKGDAVNQMLSTMDGPKLSDISKDMKEILEISKESNNRTKQILDEIKASRKQKEAGMFDKIEGRDNKRKIVDGIQTVILIAGGVLAVGMAFKIIGKVDFLSVVALSLGMLMVSHAFAEISQIKDLTPMKTAMVGLALVTIAGAVTMSSLILQGFKPMSMLQMFSFVVVSTALGAGSYFIFKAVKNLDMKSTDIWKYLLLPIILPAIATGIVLSSFALQFMKPVSIMQGFSAIMVGLALAAGAFAVSMVMKFIAKDGKIDVKGIGLALLIIPGIALGIVTSSWIFQLFKPIPDPLGILFGSLVMGLSMIAFLPAVYVLGKMSLKDMATGVLGSIMVAGAIAVSSWIFTMGNYGIHPTLGWTIGVGLSLILFSLPVFLLGKMNISQLLMGGLGVIVVATAIMTSSWILSIGKYEKAPPLSWALGVGLSLLMFVPAVLILGIPALTPFILIGSLMTLVVAGAIMAVSYIIGAGKYEKYPASEWATGVGLSFILFTPALLILGIPIVAGLAVIGAITSLIVAGAMVAVSFLLNAGKYDKYPTEDWIKGVSQSLIGFSIIASNMKLGDIIKAGIFLPILSASILTTSALLSIGNYNSNYPTEDWISGVSKSLTSFSTIASNMSMTDVLKTATFLPVVSASIILTSALLNSGNYSSYPSRDWIMGVSESLITFSTLGGSMKLLDVAKTNKFLPDIAQSMVDVSNILAKGTFSGGPAQDWVSSLTNLFDVVINKVPQKDQLKRLQDFIEVLKDFSKSAEKIKDSGLDKLNKLTASVTIMSVIDNQRLQSVMKVIGDNKDNISNVIESRGGMRTETTKQITSEVERTTKPADTSLSDKQDMMIERFDTVIKKFDDLLEYVISDKSPNNTGKEDTTK
jgi:hypothetical protein